MEDTNNKESIPQKTAVAPQKTAVAPQKTAVAPQKTAVAPQKTAVAPQKTAVAPQKTAVAPQKTAVAPGVASAPGAPSGDSTPVQTDSITVGGKTYKIEKQMGSGTEGDIYLVTDGKRRYALKRCHPGFQTNTAVMPALQKLNGKDYITDIIDYADDFELLEFAPEGSAAGANIRGNAEAILAIAVKVAMALNEMHKEGVIHKDIKPANILIKDKAAWDSVLCDFGIADVLDGSGKVATRQARTPIYAAPEMYAANNTRNIDGVVYCELTPAADYYALGMTILSLWMGEEAFKAKEKEMAFDKANGRIIVPAEIPDPLSKICRGLLITDISKRWDYEKIERTMNGEDVPLEEEELVKLDITFNESKNLMATTPMELGDCMAEDPVLSKKYLYSGQVERWLKPYPELAMEMQEIVETRYPRDQAMGYYAALCVLNPALPFHLSGKVRDTGEGTATDAITLKDVSNFCNDAIVDEDTAAALSSDKFLEWVRTRNAALVETFPASVENYTSLNCDVYMLRVQMIDPLSDINLRNDTSHPDYAMTGESLGRLLNKVYNIFWNVCEGDTDKIESIWNRPEYAPMNHQIPYELVMMISANFIDTVEYNYIPSFFNTKGRHFKEQLRWFLDATDKEASYFTEKAGPKDDDYFIQISWMRVIKGFGATPEYELVDQNKTVTTLKELFKENKKTLKKEYDYRGLRGFLAVNHQEDPTVDIRRQFAFEERLRDYVEDLARIDDEMEPVQRFRQATKEAADLLSEGKTKIRSLNTRSVLQYVFTLLFAVLPALFMLVMLFFAIIENPLINMENVHLELYVWIVGLLIAIVMFSKDSDGEGSCLGSLIVGAIFSVALFFIVKFLGQYILYIFAVLVLATLIFFSLKTIFWKSAFAAEARKFTKPGFDEKVLEPLYFAFSDEETFDSSFNGAFNDEQLQNWNAELKVRRIYMFVFIGIIWLLMLFSMLVPKTGRFQRLTAPLVEKIEPIFTKIGDTFNGLFPAPEEEAEVPTMGFESLAPGAQGEQVKTLQQFLKDHGYKIPVVDGDYGRRTTRAVSAFQKDAGLPQTGSVDEETVKAMNNMLKEEAEKATENTNDNQ